MTFQRPELLVLAPLLGVLLALALGGHWRRLRRLARAYDGTAVRRLLPVGLDPFPTTRLLCVVGAGVAIGLAAAGPVWIASDPPDPPPPLDLAIAVDLSLSMSANDAAPSRIGRARDVIHRLTEELPSVRFSLVVFAGWPYTLLPPTDDPAVASYFAESMQVEIVPEADRGNSLASTLSVARDALATRPTPGGRQAVLVLTDGDVYEDEPAVTAAAAAVAAEGLAVWVGGLGTEAEASLFVDGEPVFDARGLAVTATRNTALLRSVADAGRGRYEDVSVDQGLESLVAELRELSGDDREADPAPLDATFIVTLLAIPLLMWESLVDAGRGTRPARGPEGRA